MQELLQTEDISKSQALKSEMWDIVNNVPANDITDVGVGLKDSLTPSQPVKGEGLDGTVWA